MNRSVLPPDDPSHMDEPASGTEVWSFDGNNAVLDIYRAEFAGERLSLRAIRAMAAAAATRTPLREPGIHEFEMAVDEICANIVEHTYEKHGAAVLLIEIGLFPDRIECIVTDRAAVRCILPNGPPLDLEVFQQQGRRRGLGLDIVRHCVDHLEHQWIAPHGNQMRLIKFYNVRRP